MIKPKLNLRSDIALSDVVELTLQRLSSKKYRTFLTILGVGIGIGVVYILVSLTFGVQKLVIGNLSTSESLLSLDVTPNTEIKDVVKLDSNELKNISSMDGVVEISPAKSLPAEIRYNDIKSQTLVYGVEPRFFQLSNIQADTGELYTDGESKVVVTTAILSLFGLSESDALGANIRLSFLKPSVFLGDSTDAAAESTAAASLAQSTVIEIPEQFTIAGIIKDDTNYLYLPLKYFDSADLDEYRVAKVKVSNQDMIEPVRDQILAKGFLVSALTDTLTQINSIFRVTQITFTIIGITALFIASIGMVNTMTVSLLERTREIGIMKAIGATSKGIRQMFLAESMIIGLGGGVGGLMIGFASTTVIGVAVKVLAKTLGGKPVNIFYTPPWFYVLVIGFSFFIGLFTGIFPAKRAASLKPLDALRYE